MSNSVPTHRWQATRLLCPWDSPGKNTGVGCLFLLQCMKVKSESEVTQSCPTLSDPMDCSLPGSSFHGIFQARVLEWVATAFSRGSSRPRDWTHISCIGRWVLYHWATREASVQINSFQIIINLDFFIHIKRLGHGSYGQHPRLNVFYSLYLDPIVMAYPPWLRAVAVLSNYLKHL